MALNIVPGDQAWGTIIVELEAQNAPITVKNFLGDVDDGYNDGTLIHRIVVGENTRIQVFQSGGYTELNGASKPGQHDPITLESNNGPKKVRGTIAMARDAAPDTATAEYHVNIEATPKLSRPTLHDLHAAPLMQQARCASNGADRALTGRSNWLIACRLG